MARNVFGGNRERYRSLSYQIPFSYRCIKGVPWSAVCILECLGVILFLPLALLQPLCCSVEGKLKGKPKYKSHIVLESQKQKDTHTQTLCFFAIAQLNHLAQNFINGKYSFSQFIQNMLLSSSSITNVTINIYSSYLEWT